MALIPLHDRTPYLASTAMIDVEHPMVQTQAAQLAAGQSSAEAIALACFEWVRDHIRHSVDYQQNPVTCRASDVLQHRTGYCYAKSHLLAALLRANQIPAGLCYQRLSIDDQGAPYCLHGLNAVYLPDVGWYRIDPRGNRDGVNAQFIPPKECLAFAIPRSHLPDEYDFPWIFAEPLPNVVAALDSSLSWDAVLTQLPDADYTELKAIALRQRSISP